MAHRTETESWQTEGGDMPPAQFREYGYRIVDWIADYLAHSDRYPVLSTVTPGDIRSALPIHPPTEGEAMDAIIQDFEKIILPGITHWNHPSFFAYFAITGSAPGVLAEMLSAALNVNAMLWRTSPAASELEVVVLDWLRQMLGLSGSFEGVIYDTASISSLVAIAAAREALGLEIRRKGMAGRPELPALRVYCSEEAHSSIEKDAITLGLGQEGVRKISVDDEFRMDVETLRSAVREDRDSGLLPFCVVATAGTTSTTSVDPVPAIADICRNEGLWLHVDASYAGAAAVIPEMRWVLDGVDNADSVVVNPHKWLFTQVDLSAFYSRRLDVVRKAFSLVPEYLRTPEGEGSRNYMDYGPQLGRRFRALKLWFVLRSFGQAGLASRLKEHIELAHMFAAWVDADPQWERLAPTPFSTVCFRAHPPGMTEKNLDHLNEEILRRVNDSGLALLSHTRLHGHLTLRLAIGHIRTTEQHIRSVWQELQTALQSEVGAIGR